LEALENNYTSYKLTPFLKVMMHRLCGRHITSSLQSFFSSIWTDLPFRKVKSK